MGFLRLIVLALAAVTLLAQSPQLQDPPPPDFVCPMDPDVRSKTPGKCPRCGMTLVPGIPDPIEYPVELTLSPKQVKPGAKAELSFRVVDPKTGKPVRDFQVVHEKLFHLFVVSQDLRFFIHDHPTLGTDAIFRLTSTFPESGLYRLVADFYPQGGTPQLVVKSIIIPGPCLKLATAALQPDLSAKHAENLDVSLNTEPPQPIAGMKTLMFFKLNPADGLEPYLGAWGHMLAASSDVIDLIHNHPFLADGGPQVQFNMIFPRPGVYRVWVQFQRKGIVNTATFDVPVSELK